MDLEVFCFGEFEVRRNGRRLALTELGSTRARRLLQVLLTRPGTFFTKDQLIEALWDARRRPKDPGKTLRHYVYRLRKALEPEVHNGEAFRVLRTGEDGSYGFFTDGGCWLDTQAFEDALDRAEELIQKGSWDEVRPLLEEAVALVRGEFLAEARYEDWARPRREFLEKRFCQALVWLAEACACAGAWERALRCCERALELVPVDEDIGRRLMRYACHAGHRARALEVFERLCAHLREELHVEPEPETLALQRQILAGELEARPTPAPPSPPRASPPIEPAAAPPRRPVPWLLWSGAALVVLALGAGLWSWVVRRPAATPPPPVQVQFFQGRMDDFLQAADFPAVMIDFDELAAGTDLEGRTLAGVRFSKRTASGAPLLVVRGWETFTPAGYRCQPRGDPETHKLFPTSGAQVLSPGGTELAPGPNPALEDDDVVLRFVEPVRAVGFDLLWQAADGGTPRRVTVKDAHGNVLEDERVSLDLGAPGVAAPGGSAFVGFVASENAIAEVALDEADDDNCHENANAGLDTIRFRRRTPATLPAQTYAFVREWGGRWGRNPGEFNADAGPRGLALAEREGATFVYVSDYVNGRIQVFDAEGRFLRQFFLAAAVQDLEYDGQGALYVRAVSDAGGVLLKLDAAGGDVLWQAAAPAAEWISYGLCLDATGNVHVPVALSTKPEDHQVYKYAPDGQLLLTYGAGLVKGGGNCEASERFVYVTDGSWTNLRKFSPEGELVETVHIGPGIQAIALERDSGALFLAVQPGPAGVSIRKYAPDLTLLAAWGGAGGGLGRFSPKVRDLELGPDGSLYVADGYNGLIQVFRPR